MAIPPAPPTKRRPRAPAAPARPGPRLLWEADALLAVIPELRATGFVPDLGRVRERLAALLRDFHSRARRDGIEPMRVEQATEVLAALIDHVVTSMPWGADAGWQSLGAAQVPLSDKPEPVTATQRLLEVARRSFADTGMRELIGVALALGLEGGGPGAEDVQISQLRAQLAADAARDGAQPVQPPVPPSGVERRSAWGSWLPLWVSSAVVAGLLALLFFSLRVSLGAKSDRLYSRIATLEGPANQLPRPLAGPQSRLGGLLARQLAARTVQVRDEIDRSVVVVPGSELFIPESASLRQDSAALLRSIAAAVRGSPGRIQVVGHTDGLLSRSARYPSDWDLSVDRARAVQDSLHQFGIEATRLSFDGRAAVEPAAADSNSGHDGRVEIILLAGR